MLRFPGPGLLALGCAVYATEVHAAARIGELDVRTAPNGQPCFTVTAKEEKQGGAPNFQSIAVIEAASNSVMWKMTMPRERTFPVSAYMCVPYGGRPPVLPQTPAAPLQPGKLYDVTITTAPATALSPRQYRTRFCLSGQGGQTRIEPRCPGGRAQ
ncbi:MAG: hypothetical protein ACLGI6_01035 [Gammaproteobacteria bacterium]